MLSRRTMMQWSAGGVAATVLGPGLSGPAQAQSMVPVGALSQRNFHVDMLKVLSRSDRIAIPSYRFGVVVRSGISATGASGSVTVEASADLVGVDMALLQQVAHQAFSDFVARMRATGRTLLTWEEIAASEGFGKLEPTPEPFLKKPFADARTVALVAPEYLPMVSLHLDAPLSDKSPFQLGNWRALNSISAKLKCLVMIPTVVFDFAELTGSGHKAYGGDAQVGVDGGMYLVPQFTQLHAFHAKIALAGEGARMLLTDRVTVGQAGTLVQASSFNNRDEIEQWNAYVRTGAWYNQPWSAGPLRPTQAYDYSTYQYAIDPTAFTSVCVDGASAVHGVFAGAVSANPAA